MDEIDSIYFEKPYYLEPDKGADKAYALLRDALEKSKKVGIAKYVLRNREQLAVVKPMGDFLVLDQMRFAGELRQPEGLRTPDVEVQEREMDMAKALIEQLTETFDPEKYHDTYSDELMRVIHEKIEGKEPTAGEAAPVLTGQVPDLVALLKASLEAQPKESGEAGEDEAEEKAAAKPRERKKVA